MSVKKIFVIVMSAILICSCENKYRIKPSLTSATSDSILRTGWYFVTDTSDYKRNLDKSSKSYFINPSPILTSKNFKTLDIFTEKGCKALIIMLDSLGSKALYQIKKKSTNEKLAFIIDNKLIRIQLLTDTQFARVEPDTDIRVYGELLAIPCYPFTIAEVKNFRAMIINDKKNADCCR